MPGDEELRTDRKIDAGCFASEQLRPTKTLRVVSWNINRGYGFRAIAEFLTSSEPDVVLLQECDVHASRTGFRNVAHDLAQSLKMNYVFGLEFIELAQGARGLPARHGQATLSRFSLQTPRILRFRNQSSFWNPRWFIPNLGAFQRRLGGRIALVSDITLEQRPLTIYNVHLESKGSDELRRRQLREVLDDARENATDILVAGDFNFDVTADRAASVMLGTHLTNPFASKNAEPTILPQRWRRPRTIDWMLTSESLQTQSPRVHVAAAGSDHYPLSLTLQLP